VSGGYAGAGGIGGLLARSHGYSGGSWSSHNFYHADGNGNVTALASSAGALQASYKYDPYGRYLGGSGTLAAANLMRFSSKPWVGFGGSATAGLYYYGYRFYDPYLQRWVNRDPIRERGGINVFAFVRNAPLNGRDAWGLITDDSIAFECDRRNKQITERNAVLQLGRARVRVLCDWLKQHHPELNVNCDEVEVGEHWTLLAGDANATSRGVLVSPDVAAYMDSNELVVAIAHEFMHLWRQPEWGQAFVEDWFFEGVGHLEIYTDAAKISAEFIRWENQYQ
jgi:RHS repeat-associated protein